MTITLRFGLQIVSDLHLEKPAAYGTFEIPPKAPHLALIGDIGHAKDPGLFEFLRTQLRAFKTVFFVPGNHEPYESTWNCAKAKFQEFQQTIEQENLSSTDFGKFVCLDQSRHDLSPTITILGCTLFSDVLPEQYDDVSVGLNDFYLINDWTVDDHVEAHTSDLDWLNEQVSSISSAHPRRKLIILTHYSPMVDGNGPVHISSEMSSGFMTDLSSEPCWTNPNVRLWAFGHTHHNCDFKDDQTGKRVVANQRGHEFDQAEDFDVEKILSLGQV